MTMRRVHEYSVGLKWDGNRGLGTRDYLSYARRFRLTVEGKPDIVGTADPAFHGETHLHNPEELLLAAVTSCHMLTYLALCARNGITVSRYADSARGILALQASGEGRFEEIELQPLVAVAPGSDVAAAIQLHERAHELCFIANSCSFPIHCRADVQVDRSEGTGN